MTYDFSLFDRYDNILFFDTETTGLDFKQDEIIELGAVCFSKDGEHIRYDALIQLSEGKTISPFVQNLTGITPEQVKKEGREKKEVADRFAELLLRPNSLIVAYNAQFDLNFTYWFLSRCGKEKALRNLSFLDALTVYRDRQDFPHKLEHAIPAYHLEDQVVNSHRAVDDAEAAAALLLAMEREKNDLPHYLNLFGTHPKYGVNGQKIRSITYKIQPYDRRLPLYER